MKLLSLLSLLHHCRSQSLGATYKLPEYTQPLAELGFKLGPAPASAWLISLALLEKAGFRVQQEGREGQKGLFHPRLLLPSSSLLYCSVPMPGFAPRRTPGTVQTAGGPTALAEFAPVGDPQTSASSQRHLFPATLPWTTCLTSLSLIP